MTIDEIYEKVNEFLVEDLEIPAKERASSPI